MGNKNARRKLQNRRTECSSTTLLADAVYENGSISNELYCPLNKLESILRVRASVCVCLRGDARRMHICEKAKQWNKRPKSKNLM